MDGDANDNQQDDGEDDGREGAHCRRNRALLDFRLDEGRKRIDGLISGEESRAAGEGRDDEVIKRQGDGEEESASDARHDFGHRGFPQRLMLGAA